MRGTALLEELVNAAQRQGLTVRREAMTRGVSGGGLAVVKGVPTVFVDDRASVEAQIEVLSSVLRRCDWSTVYLPPAVRVLLGAGAGEDGIPPPDAPPSSGAEGATDTTSGTSAGEGAKAQPAQGALAKGAKGRATRAAAAKKKPGRRR